MTRTAYSVAPDVDWVNGRKVPTDRTVHLTDEEATFELGLGRIAPIKVDEDGEQQLVRHTPLKEATDLRAVRKRATTE